MNRRRVAMTATAAAVALTGLGTLCALPLTHAIAQDGGPMDRGPMGRGTSGFREWAHRRVIPWSFASSRPRVPDGRATGVFIWHDRNTVHVESTDNHWFGDNIDGFIEIKGGKFDNVANEHDKFDTRYHVIGNNRIVFHFSAQDADVDGFKFNIHGGSRLVFHVGLDRHPTSRIFFGESMTPSGEDPVAYDLNK